GPALAWGGQPVESAPGLPARRDESLDKQTSPGGGEGTLRGPVGQGEAAEGEVGGQGVLVFLRRVSALGEVEDVPAQGQSVRSHGSSNVLGHAGAVADRALGILAVPVSAPHFVEKLRQQQLLMIV